LDEGEFPAPFVREAKADGLQSEDRGNSPCHRRQNIHSTSGRDAYREIQISFPQSSPAARKSARRIADHLASLTNGAGIRLVQLLRRMPGFVERRRLGCRDEGNSSACGGKVTDHQVFDSVVIEIALG